MLQPDGRLPFERRLARKAQQRRHGIEQPAQRCSTGKQRTFLRASASASKNRRGNENGGWLMSGNRSTSVGQIGQKSGGGLHRKPRGRVSARHPHRPQPGPPLKAGSHAADQKLAAPNRAIAAVAGPVQRHAHHRLVQQFVLGHHAGDVGVMVLHGHVPGGRQPGGKPRRAELRMQIVHDGQLRRVDVVHRQQIAHRFLESDIARHNRPSRRCAG